MEGCVIDSQLVGSLSKYCVNCSCGYFGLLQMEMRALLRYARTEEANEQKERKMKHRIGNW